MRKYYLFVHEIPIYIGHARLTESSFIDKESVFRWWSVFCALIKLKFTI